MLPYQRNRQWGWEWALWSSASALRYIALLALSLLFLSASCRDVHPQNEMTCWQVLRPAHTHTCALYLSISRTHANRINPCCINTHSSASHTAPQQEHLPLLRLLICDLVKDIFPHQTLLLLILHISNRKPGLQVACASTPVMPTDGILSGHHTGCCSMCLFKFPGGCYVYVPLQAEFQFHYYAH